MVIYFNSPSEWVTLRQVEYFNRGLKNIGVYGLFNVGVFVYMATNWTRLARNLQRALANYGDIVLINTSQFFSEEKLCTVTRYHIKRPRPDDKYKYVELFNTCSQIQVVMFLNDLLCDARGEPRPTDCRYWEECKAKYLKE